MDYLVAMPLEMQSISVSVPGMSRGHKVKREDIRLTHAHMYRILCDNLPPAILQTNQVGTKVVVGLCWEEY